MEDELRALVLERRIPTNYTLFQSNKHNRISTTESTLDDYSTQTTGSTSRSPLEGKHTIVASDDYSRSFRRACRLQRTSQPFHALLVPNIYMDTLNHVETTPSATSKSRLHGRKHRSTHIHRRSSSEPSPRSIPSQSTPVVELPEAYMNILNCLGRLTHLETILPAVDLVAFVVHQIVASFVHICYFRKEMTAEKQHAVSNLTAGKCDNIRRASISSSSQDISVSLPEINLCTSRLTTFESETVQHDLSDDFEGRTHRSEPRLSVDSVITSDSTPTHHRLISTSPARNYNSLASPCMYANANACISDNQRVNNRRTSMLKRLSPQGQSEFGLHTFTTRVSLTRHGNSNSPDLDIHGRTLVTSPAASPTSSTPRQANIKTNAVPHGVSASRPKFKPSIADLVIEPANVSL
eukprot:gene7667-594_t